MGLLVSVIKMHHHSMIAQMVVFHLETSKDFV